MPIQSTSQMAYASLMPHMGMRQMEVYEALRKYGSMTNSELAVLLGRPINVLTPRTRELVKLNLVCEGEKRACKITNRMAIAWKIISNTLF